MAKNNKFDHIITGPETQLQVRDNGHSALKQDFTCPICDKTVTYSSASLDRPFDYFVHSDGSPDCFEAESVSEEHRLGTEVAVKSLHNRIREVTGKPVEIDIEKWIGVRENFVIADVRVTSPLRVAAEIYYKSGRLALGRRLSTMFANDFRTYLIFHRDGRHNVDRVERYIQRIAPLRVGRFNPETLELTLGDLFSKQQIDLNRSNRDHLPNYIA